MASCFFFESRYTKPEGSLSLGVLTYDPRVKKVVEASSRDAAAINVFESFMLSEPLEAFHKPIIARQEPIRLLCLEYYLIATVNSKLPRVAYRVALGCV